jgi:hypothetical protein
LPAAAGPSIAMIIASFNSVHSIWSGIVLQELRIAP